MSGPGATLSVEVVQKHKARGGPEVAPQQLQRLLQQIGPMPAGMAIEATTHLSALPLAPWAGIAVLWARSVGALLLAGCVAAHRDV